MKTQSNFFTKKTFILTALLMVFGFGLFASPGGGDKAKKAPKTLSADEMALYQSVEAFYQKNYQSIVDQTIEKEQITKVMVYDLLGNVLQTQDSSVKAINLDKLPAKAKLLMKENGIHYYIVM